MNQSTIADRWEAGRAPRLPYLVRARDAALSTLPQIMPRFEGEDPRSAGSEDLPTRYSGLGARGFTNLSAKFAASLFPSTQPFFTYEPDLRVFADNGGTEAGLDDLIVQLSRREAAIDSFIDSGGWRARAVLMFQHLFACGNYLLRQTVDGQFRGYALDQYQVERDGRGRPYVIRVREIVSAEALESVGVRRDPEDGNITGRPGMFAMFTEARVVKDSLDSNKSRSWVVTQELQDGTLVTKPKKFNDDTFPFIPARLFLTDTDYSPSLYDVLRGELEVVEGLTQALAEDAAMSSMGFWSIDPAAGVDVDDFLTMPAGGALYARPESIQMIRANKGADMSVAAGILEQIKTDLSNIFLLFSPRHAERVTAVEINRMIQELTETLGGFLALFGTEVQIPMIRLTDMFLTKRGKLSKLPPGLATPRVVTGTDAIGRGRHEQSLVSYGQALQVIFGPEVVAQRLKFGAFSKQLAADKGLDPEVLVYSDEEIKQQQEQAQQQQAVAQNLGAIIDIAKGNQQQQ